MDGRSTIYRMVLLSCFASYRIGAKSQPMMLILGGHGSGISLVTCARENDTIIFYLPPHTTDILQLLDVNVFRTVKRAWGQISRNYKTEKC